MATSSMFPSASSQHTAHAPANHLAGQSSPYLAQHVHDPVDWHPWTPEALALARERDVPLFVSIGYSACHWCHVMQHESFQDPRVAALLNAHYVCIKVDREERPDVDRIYMAFVQASTGGGGWPLTVFLTPDLHPILGGTYFPPVDRPYRPSFSKVVSRLAALWKDRRADLVEQGRSILQQMREHLLTGGDGSGVEAQLPEVAEVVARGVAGFGSQYDPEFGGFGGAPKFPRPAVFNFLFRTPEREAWAMCVHTLRRMAKGGMHDHVGGGFHRYSVDEWWHVSHFEKMLYDQAQLLCSYSDAAAAARTADPLLADTAADIVRYVLRDLTAPQTGAFYCAEDADSIPPPSATHNDSHPDHKESSNPGQQHKEEGAFYVWTVEEIEAAIDEFGTPELRAPERKRQLMAMLTHLYGLKPEGNVRAPSDPLEEFRKKRANVLHKVRSMGQVAARAGIAEPDAAALAEIGTRTILFAARERRPHPAKDTKILAAWNGMMISGLVRGYWVLGHAEWLRAAERALHFVLTEMRAKLPGDESGREVLYRTPERSIRGGLSDYACVIAACIDCYEATGTLGYLQAALGLQDTQDVLFADCAKGGYYDTDGSDPTILLRMKEDYDGAEPAGASVSGLNLVRLAELASVFANDTLMGGDGSQPKALGIDWSGRESEFADKAARTVASMGTMVKRAPVAVPQMCVARLALGHRGAHHMVFAKGQEPDAGARLEALKRVWGARLLPFATVAYRDEERTAAYYCSWGACQLPAHTPEALEKVLPPGVVYSEVDVPHEES
jgi:uncharacterized protein YyaL (SSP411 family)